MSYKVLQKQVFVEGPYKILPVRMQDRYVIMKWRNEQLDILRQAIPLTKEMQDKYFDNIVKSDFDAQEPRQILVGLFLDDNLIGYGGLVHLKWIDKRAEVSFLLATERNASIDQFKVDYSAYLKMIKELAFSELRLNKLTTEAFDLRPYLIETLEANNFVEEGRLKKHNYIGDRFVDSILHACFQCNS